LVAGGLVVAAAIIGGVVWMQASRGPAGGGAAIAAAVAPDPNDKVVATVNGQKIMESDLAVADRELSEELANVPAGEARRQALIDSVINLAVLAQAAEQAKLADTNEFKQRMALLRERVLRSEYIRSNVMNAASDDEVKKRYDAEITKLDLPDEVKASHILVATEDEAKAVIDELDKGGDFAAIAKDKSTDKASGAKGGDLGYFTKEDMVKEFADAAFEMKPGEVSKTPVKSQFGFHVIKVEDRRKQAPPAFDDVKDQVKQMVVADIYRDTLKKLKDAAKIEIVPAIDIVPKPGAAPAPDAGPTTK
jgi:peptidyl-prolyl cis-trans isomerase C